MSEWQPIETAPRNGEVVLLYGHDTGSRGAKIVTGWSDGASSAGYKTINGERWDWWKSSQTEADGCECCGYYDRNIEFSPSHWMPLPEPPK